MTNLCCLMTSLLVTIVHSQCYNHQSYCNGLGFSLPVHTLDQIGGKSLTHTHNTRTHTHTKRYVKKDMLKIPQETHMVETHTKIGSSQQMYSHTKQKERKSISDELSY